VDVNACFDLTPILVARRAKRASTRWLLIAFSAFLAGFLALLVWFGFSEGIGPFTVAAVGIGGGLTIAFLFTRYRQGDPTELRTSSSGLELAFERGPPTEVEWAKGKFRIRIFSPDDSKEWVAGIPDARPVELGWNLVVIPEAATQAILESAMAHPLVTVLTAESRRGDPTTRFWDLRPRRVRDFKIPREVVA
jgi:hypothetical protein